jgi:hypothetical protein
MFVKLRHIALFLSLASCFGVSAQTEWRSFLPKLEPSTDFSVWTAINYNYSLMLYNAGAVNPIKFMSNNRLSQTIGIDYASYTLQYTFRLPFNTLDRNSPLSSYYRLETGYGASNWEIDAYISHVRGWFDVIHANIHKNPSEQYREDSRYRNDMRKYTAGLTAFYFLSEKYRYSHAMKYAYQQNQSGFTFYSSLKHKYHWLRADSAFYPNSMELIENPMNRFERLFVFESSMTFGFTGLLTDGSWFFRGLVGFGPGIQIQNYNKNNRMRTRPFISPAGDAKLSFGYKTNGLYMSFNIPFEAIFVYLPNQTYYFQMNPSFSFSIGFQMHDLIRTANQRNLNEFQTL